MPDKFNLIDVSGNEAAIDKLIKKVEEAIPVFNNMQRSINDVNNALRNGTPRDYVNSLQEVARLNQELARTNSLLANSERDLANARNESTRSVNQERQGNQNNTRSTNELTDAERRLAQVERQLAVQRSEQAAQIARIREETNRLNASHRETAREQLRIEGLSARERTRLGNTVMIYNAVQQKMNKLQNEYKNLALAKQMGMSLTDKEIQRMDYLEKRIQKYDQALKAVDASMGRHQRNVGNYSSGFNSLNNSVAQIAREMPAFTYSIQTGFMAISNNLPIFFDSMKAAAAQNAALRAEGKATVPVWKQLGSALFSWNTLLSVGITLLTVYGKEIGNWIKKMFEGNSVTSMLKKNTEDLNKARQEGAKSSASEISTLDTLYRVATNENASKEARIRAINKMQGLYPSFFKNISDEIIMIGNAKDKYLQLRSAILDSAKARAIGTILEKRQEEQLLKEEEIRRRLDIATEERNKLKSSQNQSQTEYVRDNQGGLILKDVSNTELLARNARLIYGYIVQIKKLNNDFVKSNKSIIDENVISPSLGTFKSRVFY